MFKEVVTPLRRRTGPDHFQAAGERIRALTGAKAVLPSEALLLNRSTLRLRSHLGAGTRAVRLAKGVAARNQGNGFFVIHRHATESLTNILDRCNWIRLAFRAFRVDVNQPHGGRSERIFEIAFAGVALVSTQPSGLRTPVNVLIRFLSLAAPPMSTEGLEAQRFQGFLA